MIKVDTNGLMDRCDKCGAQAGVEIAKTVAVSYRCRCSECPETGPDANTRSMAKIKWNKRQRLAKFAAECGANA